MLAEASNRLALPLLAVLVAGHFPSCRGKDGAFGGQEVFLKLPRISFPVRIYEPEQRCRGLILFASGDGGWKEFEDKICRYFASQGFAWSVGTAENSPIQASMT